MELSQTNPEQIVAKPIELNYTNVEVKSRNYATLFEAMGKEKYLAFVNSSGLGGVPENIANAIRDYCPDNCTVSSASYIEKGVERKSLFFHQKFDGGYEVVFTVDPDKSKPYIYRLDNLYVVGFDGKTVDLLEEVDNNIESYYTPTHLNAFYHKGKKLLFGDLNQTSKQLGINVGIPIYLHEIGHCYDSKINKDFYRRVDNTSIRDKQLSLITVKLRNIIDNKVVDKLSEYTDGNIQYLIDLERNASNYAAVFMVRKRSEGVDLCPDREGGEFFTQLDKALGSYEIPLLGKRVESTDEAHEVVELVHSRNPKLHAFTRALLAVRGILR